MAAMTSEPEPNFRHSIFHPVAFSNSPDFTATTNGSGEPKWPMVTAMSCASAIPMPSPTATKAAAARRIILDNVHCLIFIPGLPCHDVSDPGVLGVLHPL